MDSRFQRWIPGFDLLLLLGAVVLFYPCVGLPGWISPGGDMVNLMLPAREWASQWLGRGLVPLWNPQTFGGAPFLGAMQAAVFYPPNLVAGAALPSLAAINALRLAHIYLFGALTWLFLRVERGCCRPAALLGALAVAGSAHVASHTDHINQLAAMAWLPALVACQWRFWRTGSRVALLVLVVVLAIQVLAGHPQAVFYSLLLSGAIAAAWLVRGDRGQRTKDEGRRAEDEGRGKRNEGQRFEERDWSGFAVSALKSRGVGERDVGGDAGLPGSRGASIRRRVGRLVLLGVAVAGGFLLASIQLVPTAETARFSRRRIDGPEFPWFGAMPRGFRPAPDRWIPFWWAMVAPRSFADPRTGQTHADFGGESVAFFGRLTVFLAIVALIAGIANRSLYPVFWALAVIGAFILALGPYGPFMAPGRPSPVFQAYLWLLPPARHLRVPPRILLLATFGMAVLGAEGLHWIWCRRWWMAEARRRKVRFLAGWGAVVVLAIELWSFQRGGFHNTVVRHHPPDLMVSGSAAQVLAPVLPAASRDATLADFRVFRLMINDPDYLMDPRPEAVRNRYIRLQPNLGMLLGVAEVDGYEEGLLPPVRYFDFLRYFNGHLLSSDPDAVLLGLMNVRYVYADYNTPVRSKVWRPVGEVWEPVTERRYGLYENPLWLPRVIWSDWLPEQIALKALRGSLSRGGPPSERLKSRQRYAPDLGALVARGRLIAPENRSSLAVRTIEPNRIVVENAAQRGGTLVVSQNVYPGWVARAGGESFPLRPLNDFSGVVAIPPGAAQIEIAYRPFSFRIGAYLSALALAIWLALAVAAPGRPGESEEAFRIGKSGDRVQWH